MNQFSALQPMRAALNSGRCQLGLAALLMSAGAVFDGELSKVFDGRGYGRFREAA
jgi:hypothetical protein